MQRGEASENSIKDFKRALKGDRLSCSRFWANQCREAKGTELAEAQMDTLRLRLLKIGVRVVSTARRIWFHLSSSFPWRDRWLGLARELLRHAPN